MSTAFSNARVIVGEGRELDNTTVKIDRNTIVDVSIDGDSSIADFGIDLEGRTLMPGLIDTPVHLVGEGKAIGYGDEVATFKMQKSLIRYALDSVEAARVTLHASITTVRETATRNYIDVFMKEAQASGQIECPPCSLRVLVSP